VALCCWDCDGGDLFAGGRASCSSTAQETGKVVDAGSPEPNFLKTLKERERSRYRPRGPHPQIGCVITFIDVHCSSRVSGPGRETATCSPAAFGAIIPGERHDPCSQKPERSQLVNDGGPHTESIRVIVHGRDPHCAKVHLLSSLNQVA
jgi:hypothetical protein